MTAEAPVHAEPGLFSQRLSVKDLAGRPCLFLDRDGVMVEETHYLHRVEDVVLISGVAEAIAKANAAGAAVVMVTNQAGIGRGFYGWEDFRRVQQQILALCASVGGRCDMVLACAYHREGISPYDVAAHDWRKPQPGMLFEASRTLGVDLSRSYIVGDTLADLAAGARAGLPGGSLVLTGHGQREWNERGESEFALYEKSGCFTPHLARDGAEAIEHWLAGVSPDVSAA